MSRVVHVHLSVPGALATFTNRDLRTLCVHADGSRATAQEAKEFLIEELVNGRKAIPIGEPCEGFDYSGGGCPGHDVEKSE